MNARTASSRRFTVPILSAVLCGMGLITAVSYIYTKRFMENMSAQHLVQAVRFVDVGVTNQVRAITGDVVVWSQEDVLAQALSDSFLGRSARASASRRLAARLAYEYYTRLNLVDARGEIVASSSPKDVGAYNLSDRPYFKRAMAGEIVAATLEENVFSGKPSLVLAAPVYSRERHVVGFLLAVVDIGRLVGNLLETARIGENGEARVLEADSGRELSRETGETNEPPIGTALAWQLRQSAGSFVVRGELGGREIMAAGLMNDPSGWLLAVCADSREVLRPVAKLAALNGAITLGILLLVGVALTVLRKVMVNLKTSESRYRNLAATIPVGVLCLDASGRATYANERAQEILGLPPGRLPEPGWDASLETRQGRMMTRGELPFEPVLRGQLQRASKVAWLRDPSGARRVIAMNTSRQPGEGTGPAGLVVALEDLTESTRIQEMMLQNEKMLSIGGLAAGMAHEINNPLASVLQSLQVVNRRLDPGNAVNCEHAQAVGLDLDSLKAYMRRRELDVFLADIHEAGVRAAKIVSNMLGFARKSVGEFTPCALSEIIDKAIDLAGGDYDLKKQYDFKHIKIIRDYAPAVPDIQCERLEMEQVFFNLIKNAAQAFKDGTVENHAPCIRVSTSYLGSDRGVMAQVADNGPGMNEEAANRAFEPFYTSKEVGVGTGLGLSVAYFIVTENHKGSLTMETGPGKGCTFTIVLPVSPLHQPVVSTASCADPSPGS